MEQTRDNKAMEPGKDGVKTKESFFYPNEGITIEATSQEEADKELEARLTKKTK